MNMPDQSDFIPEEIVVSRDRGSMRLVWSDGREATLGAISLRAACRCAWCTRDRILNRFAADDDPVELEAVDALGSHGLHLKFSDGHQRGIFPWAYLVELAREGSCAPASDQY